MACPGIDGKELTLSSFSEEVSIQAQEHESMGPLRGRRGITNKERDFKNKNIESESTHSTQGWNWNGTTLPPAWNLPHDPLLSDTSYSYQYCPHCAQATSDVGWDRRRFWEKIEWEPAGPGLRKEAGSKGPYDKG